MGLTIILYDQTWKKLNCLFLTNKVKLLTSTVGSHRDKYELTAMLEVPPCEGPKRSSQTSRNLFSMPVIVEHKAKT